MNINRRKKIYIAGHAGLVGRALLERFAAAGFSDIVVRSHKELDLENEIEVRKFFREERPSYVLVAAAKVGGILANLQYPVDFLLCNIRIQTSIITCAYDFGVEKLLFLGSSCIYPKFAPQPIPESALLSGPLEASNECYAVARIAGIKMCQALRTQHGFNAICVMSCSVYGEGDNFHLEHSHVIPALIRRFYEAKVNGADVVTCWGTGNVKREFIHSSDLADACLFLMDNYRSSELINVGPGDDIDIRDLVDIVKGAVGYVGKVHWETSKPDGTPRKVLDVSRLYSLGWRPAVALLHGIQRTVQWYIENQDTARK